MLNITFLYLLSAVLPVQASSLSADVATLTQEFRRLYPAAQVLGDVHGIKLRGTPEALKITREVIANKDLGQIALKAWPKLATGCTDVVCALARVFKYSAPSASLEDTKTAALMALILAKRSGYIISAAQSENIYALDRNGKDVKPGSREQVWTPAEVKAIYRSVTKLPANFQNIPSLRYFFRQANGLRYQSWRVIGVLKRSKPHSSTLRSPTFEMAKLRARLCSLTAHLHMAPVQM